MRLALTIAASFVPTVMYAQEAPPQTRKPVRGWFGAGRTAPGEGRALSLTGRVFGTFDSQVDTAYPDLQAGVRYDRKTRNRSMYFSAVTSHRKFAEFGGLSSFTHDAIAGFATSLGRRTRVQVDQSFRKSPFYLVTVLPRRLPEEPMESVQAPESSSDYALFRRPSSSLASGVSVTHFVARHSSLTFNYGLGQSRTDDSEFRTQDVKASFNQQLGRYAVARAGYGRRLTDRKGFSGSNEPGVTASHDIDVGIDYHRPLTLSRRTKVMVGTGSAIVPVESAHRYRFLATASLEREIGRTWKASLNYGRNVEFLETLTEPLLSDTFALRLGGRFSRRLDLAVSANLSRGAVGFDQKDVDDHRYDTYGGSARLRWAISRLVTSYGEYVTYSHGFGRNVQLPLGFGRDVKRSEVRVGLTVWAPLIR